MDTLNSYTGRVQALAIQAASPPAVEGRILSMRAAEWSGCESCSGTWLAPVSCGTGPAPPSPGHGTAARHCRHKVQRTLQSGHQKEGHLNKHDSCCCPKYHDCVPLVLSNYAMAGYQWLRLFANDNRWLLKVGGGGGGDSLRAHLKLHR